MAYIMTSKSSAPDVRRETARRTGDPRWDNKRRWLEFLDARHQFLSTQTASFDLTNAEKAVLEEGFAAWATKSREWWAAKWTEFPDLVQWHVKQWLKSRREAELDKAKGKSQEEEDGGAGPSSASTGATQFYDSIQEDGGAGPSSAPVEPTTGATKFYDPTRDAWKGS